MILVIMIIVVIGITITIIEVIVMIVITCNSRLTPGGPPGVTRIISIMNVIVNTPP